MRSEGSPLDLNHLPEDFTRDGKQVYEDTSTSGQRRKKNNNQEDNKVYECRFCSLKFCKSQALGGHMNRHRQERETETLNKARQLVYTTDHNPAVHPHSSHLGSYVAPSGVYHPHSPTTLQPPQVYPTRQVMLPGVAPPRQPPQYNHHQPYLYTSTQPQHMLQSGDYYMAHGHALTGSTTNDFSTNYACIGAPVGIPGLAPGGRDGLDTDM